MKLLVSILVALLASKSLAAERREFDQSFPPFKDFSGTIIWSAPSSALPSKLWVYKTVPQSFPAAAISNLMAMAAFTAQNKLPGTGIRYANKDYSRYLTVDPGQGCVDFFNEDAMARMSDPATHRPAPVEGVPDTPETEDLALAFLQMVGIDRSQVVTKPNSSKLLTFGEIKTRTYLDKKRGVEVTNEIVSRGIFVNRKIDGVAFAGIGIGGGLEMEFGNHAELIKLKLVWRNLQRNEQLAVASEAKLEQFIRNDAVLTHKNPVEPRAIKTLTITAVRPLYKSALGDVAQSFVYPFAEIDAIADLGDTKVPIQLQCPILTGDSAITTQGR